MHGSRRLEAFVGELRAACKSKEGDKYLAELHELGHEVLEKVQQKRRSRASDAHGEL